MSPGPLVGEGEGAEVGHLDQDNDDDHDGNRCGVVCLWKEQLDSAWWQLHTGDQHNHDVGDNQDNHHHDDNDRASDDHDYTGDEGHDHHAHYSDHDEPCLNCCFDQDKCNF